MKILMVSIPSLHFFRWTNQLKDSGHEVYWFDVTGMSAPVEKIDWVFQKTGWKLRYNYPGRVFVKKYFSKFYGFLQQFNEYNTSKTFEDYLSEIQPDVVHSFALYVSCTPIIEVMEKYSSLKWIYSSWGSDLFYFQNYPDYLKDIKRVLARVDYLFTDCNRDFGLAQKYGFKGEFLGVFPGGGGFDLEQINEFSIPYADRKTILVKGFQGRSGRVIPVLKAIELLKNELGSYQIVVFGADKEVVGYTTISELNSWPNFQIHEKISHEEVLKLMGKSLIYIGNSNSDGMPNTLLEAVCAGAFPIQSNPGGATAEIITNGINGFLIDDCENENEIRRIIIDSILKDEIRNKNKFQDIQIIQNIEYNSVKACVLKSYNDIFVNI